MELEIPLPLFFYTSNGDKMVLFLQENLPICPRFQYITTFDAFDLKPHPH